MRYGTALFPFQGTYSFIRQVDHARDRRNIFLSHKGCQCREAAPPDADVYFHNEPIMPQACEADPKSM